MPLFTDTFRSWIYVYLNLCVEQNAFGEKIIALLPLFHKGSIEIGNNMYYKKENGRITYFQGIMPFFHHAEEELQSFRLAVSLLAETCNVKQIRISQVFGISYIFVKRCVIVIGVRVKLRIIYSDPNYSNYSDPELIFVLCHIDVNAIKQLTSETVKTPIQKKCIPQEKYAKKNPTDVFFQNRKKLEKYEDEV